MTTNDTDWKALQQADDMAYFRAELCLYSPESYTLEEKRDICNKMPVMPLEDSAHVESA